MKICNKCLLEKNITKFPKTGKVCKTCISKFRKIYKEENKDKIRDSSKKYYLNNKDKILEYSKIFNKKNKEHYKKYREENKDKININHKRYVERNKEIIKDYGKKYRNIKKEILKEYKLNYYEKNKENINKKTKEYYLNNKERKKEYDKAYRDNNKEIIKIRNKKYRDNNKEKISNSLKNKLLNNELFKLKFNLRNLIRSSFRNKGLKKNSKTSIILGCSFEEFKLYLESKFENWMTWENYGKYNGELNYGWDIDHIIPVSSAITEEEIIKLNNYSNLQPLCSKINRDIKRNNISII